MSEQTKNNENPLLSPFRTLHETAPFARIRNEHFMPAFQEAIREAKAEVQAILDNPDAPTFENTIEALERSARRLSIIRKIFFNLNSAETSDEIQQIAQEAAPLLSEFSNDISLNEELFMRVKSVYEQKDQPGLLPEQRTLLENAYQEFVRNGANLDGESKARYRTITASLSKLGLQFQQNVLAETNAFELHLTNEADLSGLPEFVREAAALAAREKNREGWIFTLQHPSYAPFMKINANCAK